jgi:tRNA(Arg) A34 adenosine deaminase TadA
MILPSFHLCLPTWLADMLPPPERTFTTPESRMSLVIEMARCNILRGSGGPFGAAVFDLDNGQLIAPGVNLVTSANCSVAHAEMVALMLAQKRVNNFSFAAAGLNAELTTSTVPCAMCLGAIPWAGLKQLACGARESDARAVGFDEGDKPPRWPQLLEKRGVRVLRDICRDKAVGVLQEYRRLGGEIYNGKG